MGTGAAAGLPGSRQLLDAAPAFSAEGPHGMLVYQFVVFSRVLLAEMLTAGLLLQSDTVSMWGSSALLQREAAVI